MVIFISGLLILWGGLVLYSALFKMNERDYTDDGPIGVSGFIEFEFLSKILNRTLPLKVTKGMTILIGISFVTFGTVLFFV